MSNSVKIRIGFGVGFFVLVVMYFFYVEGNKVPTIKTKEIGMEEIYKVEFISSNASNGAVLLFRDGESWYVGPRAYRGDKRAIYSTLSYFSRKFSLELVSRDPGYYLSSGLDSKSMRIVRMYGKPVSLGGEDILLKEVKVGRVHPSSSDSVYVMGEDGYVYKISSYGFSSEISRDIGHFRTKKIFPTESIGSTQKCVDSLESVDFFGISFGKKDVTEEQKKKLQNILGEGEKKGEASKASMVSFLWRSDTGVTLHPEKAKRFLQGVFDHSISSEAYLVDGSLREGDLKKYLFFEFSCRSTEGQQWTLSIYKHPDKSRRDKGEYVISSSELKSLVLISSSETLIKSIPADWNKDWHISL